MTRRQVAWFYGLLAVTLGLYLCSIGLNGWANPYYSAAVQAGTQNWTAFFYGSFDAANAITTDKTPLSLWLMGLSARTFGFNPFAVMLPNILAGVASIAVLFMTLRSRFGYLPAWWGAFTLALTPVAVAVFRFNDPDALLTLLMLVAVVTTFRLNRTGRPGWALLIGAVVGLGFMTKMLQAFLILPALAVPYLLFGRPRLAKRLLHLLLALIGLVIAGGWWVAIVAATPANARPYIGGTQTNAILELILGYNGLGRLTGTRGNTNGITSGITALQPSITRLFGTDVGGHIAWLIPLAFIAAITGIIIWFRTRRDSARFFETTVWLVALVVTGITFSFMQGIFHQYYTVALAPYIAALTATGIYLARTNWGRPHIRWVTIGTLAITGLLGANLLSRAVGQTLPAAITVIATILGCVLLGTYGKRHERRKLTIAAIGITLFFGQVVYGYHTLTTAQLASIPVAGPTVVFPFTTGLNTTKVEPRLVRDLPTLTTRKGTMDDVYSLIRTGGTDYTWAAGISHGLPAAHMQLATREPILELGGYNATDPFPTLTQFKRYVSNQQVRYYVLTGTTVLNKNVPLTQAQRIEIWVREHYAPTIIDNARIYDLQPVNG